MNSPLHGRSLDYLPTSAPGDGKQNRKDNAATGASAAGIRALSAQMIQFYFRAPVKAFMRTRVDYLAYARAINPSVKENASWSWRTSTPGVLTYAVKTYGWGFIPRQILPPMVANVSVGVVLYTSYLQTLGALYEPASFAQKRVHPPPPLAFTTAAGFCAGSIQSLFAAPLDALQVRFQSSEMMQGRYKSIVHYAYETLRTIGLRGVFSGYSLSFLKDSFGSAVFFGVFEYTKSQAYYSFLRRLYGQRGLQRSSLQHDTDVDPAIIRPHFAIEPTFLLLAGVAASVAQQSIRHPLTEIQNVHFVRLEALNRVAIRQHSPKNLMRFHYHSYLKTFLKCRRHAQMMGGWRAWLYKDFLWNTIRSTPSTSAGLIVFELVRRKYGIGDGEVKIEEDGFDILLP